MRRFILLLGLVLCLPVLFTCSDKSNPADNNPPELQLDINYTSDPALMVETVIDSSGGNLIASDSRGVQFQLNLPAGAVSEPTTIRMTPMATLSIAGLAAPVCAGCTGSDSLCCLHGVLLEPTGLNLDSAATLTITFSDSMNNFTSGGLVAYLDSASDEYEICLSNCDPDNNRITGQITHFSGFGSDDTRYDLLEAKIYQQGELLNSLAGTDGFYYEAGYPSQGLWSATCPVPPYYPGYPDLKQAFETMVYNAWVNHVNAVRQNLPENCDGLWTLKSCYEGLKYGEWTGFNDCEFGHTQEFESLRNSVMTDIRSMFHTLANQGKEACDEGRCEEGREKLNCVHSAIRNMGLIDDESELYSQITGWLLYCCTFTADLRVIVSNETEIWSFQDTMNIELAFIIESDTVDGAGLGEHNITMTIHPPECQLGEIISENFAQPMSGGIANEYIDLSFPGFDAEQYPVNIIIVCQGYPVETPFFGGLESEAIRRVQPHLLMQDGATDSGSGSFGDQFPIQYSFTITLHGGTQ